MRVGLIGFAHPHAHWFPDLLQTMDDIRIVGLSEEKKDMVEGILEKHKIPYYADYKQLIADCDAVIIHSENAKHAEMLKEAALARKHIFIEKPLTTTAAEALEVLRLCKENGVVVQIALPCRTHPYMQWLKETIDSGKIGKVLAVHAENHCRYEAHWFGEQWAWFGDPELAGGGAIIDHSPHVLDLLRWLLDDEVETVYAEAATLVHPGLEVEDTALLTMEFEKGTIATLDPSWTYQPAHPRWGNVKMNVIGEHGSIRLDLFGQTLQLYSEKQGKGVEVEYISINSGEFVRQFFDAARTGGQPMGNLADGLRVAEVIDAAYKSLQIQQRVTIRKADF